MSSTQTRVRHSSRFLQDERGAVALLMGLLLIPLMAGMGLVLDTGLYFFDQRGARNAADGAALAGAERIHKGASSAAATAVCGTSVNPVVLASCALAVSSYGYTASDVTVYVGSDVPHPAPAPAFNQVEVIISQTYDTLIMRLVGVSSLPFQGLAVAGEVPGSPGAVLYALDPDACAGFDRTGSGGLYVFGGGIVVDSNASSSCSPSHSAFSKTSTSVVCVDQDVSSYAGGSAPYGCDGNGDVNVVGYIDCPGSGCNVTSSPATTEGPGGGTVTGDPLVGLPGPAHTCAGGAYAYFCASDWDLGDTNAGAGYTAGHAFAFCDNDGDGSDDAARLNWPLQDDSRAQGPSDGLVSAGGTCGTGGEKVLPTSPLLTWGAYNIAGRFDVCSAPEQPPLSGVLQVEPGIYWGGIYNSGGCGGMAVHFKEGVYIVAGQDSNSPNPRRSIDLDLPSSSGGMTSDDILIFLTSNPYEANANQRPPGPVYLSTSPGITMSLEASDIDPSNCPPDNASYKGILLFVTRVASRSEGTGGSNDNNVTVQGGGPELTLSGMMYDVNGEFQAEGSFRLLNSKLIFNVLDMQNSGDVVVVAPCGGGATNQLFLLR